MTKIHDKSRCLLVCANCGKPYAGQLVNSGEWKRIGGAACMNCGNDELIPTNSDSLSV